MINNEKMIHGNELVIAILEAMNNAANQILVEGESGSIQKWQAQYILTSAFNEMLGKLNVSEEDFNKKSLGEFSAASEIAHIKGGEIIAVTRYATESGGDMITIDIRKDDKKHVIAFEDGIWFSDHISEE